MARIDTTRMIRIRYLLTLGYKECSYCYGSGFVIIDETKQVIECEHCYGEGYVHPLREELEKRGCKK